MKNNITQEIFITAALFVLLLTFLNPLHLWMPSKVEMVLIFALLVVFAVYASMVLREKPQDEREELHRMFAGRVGFLVGATVLLVGVIVESVTYTIDPWLVFALIAMAGGKVLARAYSSFRH